MRDLNERPVCHRAEDLVTYLYGEASESDALDFRRHMQHCAACRTEFAGFNQVHESISVWRNEALGASFNPAAVVAEPSIDATHFAQHERKLSALAAVREFFNVSPLWLRGATAFAGLLLCALLVWAVARSWQRPAAVASGNDDPKVFTKADFEAAVAREVKLRTATLQQDSSPQPKDVKTIQNAAPRNEVAHVRTPSKPRVKGLSLQERQQLAADLRLIPTSDEEELPFALGQPNQ